MKFGRMTAGLLGLLLLAASASAQAQGAFQVTATATGSTVNLSWPAVPGATMYGVQAQIVGGPILPLTPVGNVTSVSAPGIPPGTYNVQVSALVGGQVLKSDVATVSVAAPPAVIPAPTNLTAAINGNAVLLSWSLPATTTGLATVGLEVLSGPGGAVTAQIPLGVRTSFGVPSLPNGIYTVRVIGFGAGQFSAPSNEVTLQVPGCTPPASIPLTTFAVGSFLSISWPQVPGALGYRLDVASAPGGAATPVATFGPTQTNIATFVPLGNYYVTLHTQTSCGAAASSAEHHIPVDGTSGNGPRRPAGSIGIGGTTAEVSAAAHAVTAQSPGDLFASCGNTNWLFKVVQRLRTIDSRYGLNWKRGNVGDMSHDVIVYNYADVPDDQATAPHMFAWDVIGGHCGPGPVPQASNITNPGGQARWTILPYLQRGFAP